MKLTDTEKDSYRRRIKEFVIARGMTTKQDGSILRVSCPSPDHADTDPTAIVYDENIYCPVCVATYDIFTVAGFIDGVKDFPSQVDSVVRTLGGKIDDTPAPKQTKKADPPAKVVELDYEAAKHIFTREAFLSQSAFVGKGDASKGYGDTITGVWPYRTHEGKIDIIDVRFEGGPRGKNVVTFYYDGKHVKSKGAPVRLYGRDLLAKYQDHTVLIVEGAKTASTAESLIPFGIVPITWNGGTGKISKADWIAVSGRNIVFFPDDDEPGIKAAKQFDKIHECKIVSPYEPARELKSKGADLVEVLQLMSAEETADYIKNGPEYKEPQDQASPPPTAPDEPSQDGSPFPFRVLGVAEDNHAYFLGRDERLCVYKLESLSKGRFLMLATLPYWCNYIGTSRLTADDWLKIQDDVTYVANSRDFDKSRIRGRGAWCEKDGRICYHDGRTTTGDYEPDTWVFLKKDPQPIGLNAPPLASDKIREIKDAVFSLSFETKVDAMRLLSWSCLSPFSGALEWRPQVFLTGPSGSGKSSVESLVVKRLALPDRYNGGKTSIAGYMQSRKHDVGAVTIDEAEADTETKRKYRDDMLSVMRQSTSDDTPKSAMGTADQTGTSYTTRDMFMFIAIDDAVGSVADDNRLTRVNMAVPKSAGPKWSQVRANIEAKLTQEAANGIRARVWQHLADIKRYAGLIAEIIQDITGKNHRFAISEGTLMACYLIVWRGLERPTREEIEEFVRANYEIMDITDDRDDSSELLDLILMHPVKVPYNGQHREFTILEALKIATTGIIHTGTDTELGGDHPLTAPEIQDFKRALNNIGIGLDADRLAIANNHAGIKRITGRTSGYKKMLWRHRDCIDKSKNVQFVDSQRRCMVIDHVIEDARIPF